MINPADETVTQMDLSGDTSEISKLLGRVPLLCIYPPLKPGHRFVLWLDDEGLLRMPPPLCEIAGYNQPLPGKGVLFGAPTARATTCPAHSA